jgi:S-adenosylmethionine:tRNA ribosyltransferase-isomerase
LGVKEFMLARDHQNKMASKDMQLRQWEAYALSEQNVSIQDAMKALVKYLQGKDTNKLIAKTQLMVTPGYQFKVCNALVTNFHQPKSTLLLIIAAITGNEWKNVYAHALKNDYRFLSYGDGCLFWIHNR